MALSSAGKQGREELDTLEMVRKNPDLADIPIIVFTGMNISKAEERRGSGNYADSICGQDMLPFLSVACWG